MYAQNSVYERRHTEVSVYERRHTEVSVYAHTQTGSYWDRLHLRINSAKVGVEYTRLGLGLPLLLLLT